jgi:hypothetical protein
VPWLQALELYRSAQRVKPGCRELAGKVRSLCKSLGVATNGSGLISSAKAATDDASGRKSSKNAKAGSSSTAADTEAAAADQQQQKGAAKELWAGGHLPEAAELFQQQMLEYANTKVVREGTGFPPELHLLSGGALGGRLPGRKSEGLTALLWTQKNSRHGVGVGRQ